MTAIIHDEHPVEQQQVISTLHDIMDAAVAKDFDRLAAHHLDGPKFSKFDDFEPLDRQDATTARQSEEDGLGAVDNLTYRLDGLKVDVFGPAAVATFVFRYEFEADGEPAALRARATMVFVADGTSWKIAHEHFSPFTANAPL